MSTERRLGVLWLACILLCLVVGLRTAQTAASNPFTLAPGSPIATGAGASFVATGDLNGDGLPDVVIVNSTASNISVLLAKGGGSFQPAVNYAVGNSPADVVVADVIGTGSPQLLVTNKTDNTVSILVDNGSGIFTSPLPPLSTGTGSAPEGIAVADLNGDGLRDIVVADSGSNNVTVFLGAGLGTFTPGINFTTSTNPATITTNPSAVGIADFNGDGKLDLVTTNNFNNTVSILLGNGNGTFQPPMSINMNVSPSSGCTHPDALVIADFNGDSKSDVAVACTNSSNVSILLGKGDGTFASPVTYTTLTGSAGAKPESIAAADFDGKNGIDLVIADSSSNVVFLLNSGSGTFSAPIANPASVPSSNSSGNGAFGVAISDFNADSKPDVAVANFNDGTASILLNNGTIAVPTPTPTPTPPPCTGSSCPFILSANPTSAFTRAGTLVSYTITLTPGPAAAPLIGFSCTDPIPASSCSFNPPTVNTGNGPVNTVMSVATNFVSAGGATGKADPSQAPLSHPNKALYAMLSLGGAGIFGLVLPVSCSQKKRRRWLAAITGLVLFLVVMALQGCGGGIKQKTTPGDYIITVTGTSINFNPVQTASTTVALSVR